MRDCARRVSAVRRSRNRCNRVPVVRCAAWPPSIGDRATPAVGRARPAPRTSPGWPASRPPPCRARSTRPSRSTPRPGALVRDAVAKLRYVPHGAARSLRSQRSKMVGAVVPSFDYALYARTTSALQQRLDERGYSLVLAEQHYDLARRAARGRAADPARRRRLRLRRARPRPGAVLAARGLRPALRADLGHRSDAPPSEHRLRQPGRHLRDHAAPARRSAIAASACSARRWPATTARRARGAGVRAALAEAGPGARRALRRSTRRSILPPPAGMMQRLLALPSRGRPRWSPPTTCSRSAR